MFVKDAAKTILLYVFRGLLSPLKLFPLKKAVLFCANSGAGFMCNPKYLYLDMMNDPFFSDFKYIWCLKDINKAGSIVKCDNLVVCKYHSLKYYYYRLTSLLVISNAIEGTECPKRKKQIRLQTWHGGGSYKKVALLEKKGSVFLKARTKKNMKDTDLFISSSSFFTKNVIRADFGYQGKVIESGMPRNDVLFEKKKFDSIRNRVIETYKLDEDSLIVLYAPTWRYDNGEIEALDFDKLGDMLEKAFRKKVVFLYRQHVYMDRKMRKVVDVTDYQDMQELMIASDVLISDYSSCIWDYSFLMKPCFLFCPDLKKYNDERGFVLDIYEWGFPVATTNPELMTTIKDFDEQKFKKAMKRHHEMLGSFEGGKACEKVLGCLKKAINARLKWWLS